MWIFLLQVFICILMLILDFTYICKQRCKLSFFLHLFWDRNLECFALELNLTFFLRKTLKTSNLKSNFLLPFRKFIFYTFCISLVKWPFCELCMIKTILKRTCWYKSNTDILYVCIVWEKINVISEQFT